MNLAARILRLAGWKVSVTVPDLPKCIYCVAPHTSNVDFILGELAIRSVGRRAGFLMKKSWFFWPLGPIFRAMGGVPVDRRPGSPSLVEALVERFRSSQVLRVAITPEGTRSRTTRWHTGFLRIAMAADVPIVLAVLDFGTKTIMLHDKFIPTGNIDADIRAIKRYYSPYQGKYPEKFTTADSE
ncbi:MAG: 1-acyl-sn-glycerol-3-phosphate acyltransferase [Muribaculaceae bacterium]|nr:1-acyl-sn-glycerol-3-phosphate acyltransferase [Muribaculaceae bacterium]